MTPASVQTFSAKLKSIKLFQRKFTFTRNRSFSKKRQQLKKQDKISSKTGQTKTNTKKE